MLSNLIINKTGDGLIITHHNVIPWNGYSEHVWDSCVIITAPADGIALDGAQYNISSVEA